MTRPATLSYASPTGYRVPRGRSVGQVKTNTSVVNGSMPNQNTQINVGRY
jgi:hypothetical protein